MPFAIALLAGLAQALSIAAPWSGQPQWWLQLLSLGVLAWLLQRERPRRAFFVGWLFATTWLTATWWWLFISMHVYGGLPAALTVIAVVGLAAFLSLYYAAAAGLLALCRERWSAVAFAALWTLAELLRVTVFTGFPWGEGGYAHLAGPLAGYAPWIGVHGMTFVAALVSGALAGLIGGQRLGAALAALPLLLGLALPLAGEFSSGAGRIGVTLLQGNIPQDEKFQHGSGIPMALNWYGLQLRVATTPLVVAPETAIPLLPQQLPEGYLDTVLQRYASGTQAVLVGIPLGSTAEGYTNSVTGVKPGGSYRYDKHHLVPFGEFIPPLFRWFTEMMNIPLGDFNRGSVGQPSFDWSGQRFAPNICYEDLFGEELGRRFGDAATAPTVFVNVSNIGWFGNTIAIDQHLQISRLRALEFERPMLRATNTGATVVIDHRGRVTHSLERYTRGVLVGEVEGRNGITPYAWWVARASLWPLWLLFGGIAAFALLLRRRGGAGT